jgi:hypothetical protein
MVYKKEYTKVAIKEATVKTMVNKRFLLGMLAIVLVFGTMVVGCDNGSTNSVNTDPKNITITGIDGSGNIRIGIGTNVIASNMVLVAEGYGTVSNGSVIVALMEPNGEYWTGSGAYNIFAVYQGMESFYTGGKTFSQLGITAPTVEDAGKLPKYNITSATSVIAANQFWTP